ncbi:MAG TPA: DUF998 domain-containing protein [Mycobacterium sp.]|uniref:DUF998 domain-containing protein n=1 Tax=Mycobacterium sp. TaxID=1785 RepID=UPI002D572053|nr:DUF998 domain-containing protein [Mycobacterium sp.]HZU49094.1 DUF998 domain-containing protein [Mycobacterium sp.]
MATDTCPPLAQRVTKSLLGYGVIAGPIYVVVVAVQALGRAGFNPARHDASLLANGALGWIQVVNFIVVGLMTIAAAVGVRRALGAGRTALWGSALIAGYGVGLVGAGAFRADPSFGFPPGSPSGRSAVSWHGLLHIVFASVGFACVIAACVVMAARFYRDGDRGWAGYSLLTGAAFATGFAAVASGSNSPAVVIAFTAAVLIAWAWLAAISVKLYSTVKSVGAVEHLGRVPAPDSTQPPSPN